jgi:hypothetical protein
MIILNEYKLHHFFPYASEFTYEISAPDSVQLKDAQDYRVQTVKNINSFVFPEDHYPLREHDIFVESKTTKLIMPNRPVYVNGIEGRTNYQYDPTSRTLTFNEQIKGTYNIHWINFSKISVYQQDWRKLPISSTEMYVNKTLYQGFYKTSDTDKEQPNILNKPGTFQGGFRCAIEINTLPLFGMICYSDDLKSFMYRGSLATNKKMDTFQFRLYNPYGQESDPYCYKISMINV